MAITSLQVRGFRAIGDTTLEFEPGENYLFGPNGSGKTSLLEAVHYVATGRSFRTRRDGELLNLAGDQLLLSVAASDERGRTGRIEFDGRQKRFELDGRRFTRLSEFFGWLAVVPLLLGDVELVSGSPGRRREYLDMAAAKVDREHIGALNDYRRALVQYGRLLTVGAAEDQLEAWEAEVARNGEVLARRRADVASGLLGRAAELALGLVGGPVSFRFRGSPAGEESLTAARMRERLAASRRRARETGYPVVGPHRDDIAVRF
ncbi:MAG TPA: DNA replication and repair protein RecF, partial [candidate division WOR-3 bacterium]|nr:DNA replication and repair protein RecF [candidate division WOR-3 bacterium]